MSWCTRTFSALLGAAALIGAAGSALAAPMVLNGPSGPVLTGQSLTFTIADARPDDGYSTSLGLYLADFSFNYDSTVLQYAHSDALNPGDLLIAPDVSGATPDPDPAGSFHALLVGSASGTTPVDLFTITFVALQATGPGGTTLTVSLPDAGAYGDGGSFQPSSGGAVITAVPEPEASGLAGTGLAVAVGMAARSRRRHAA